MKFSTGLVYAVLLGGLGAVCLMTYSVRGSGPFHKGRRLSAWMEGYRKGTYQAWLRADEAIKATGTNALPVIQEHLRSRDSQRVFRGLMACQCLGPLAMTAFADVTNQLSQMPYISPHTLVKMGMNGITAVTACLTWTNHPARSTAASALEAAGSAASNAVPALLLCLASDDSYLRDSAARTLGAIGSNPGIVVPALMRLLQDPKPEVRGSAVYGLGQFGLAAKGAVPALVELANDPDRHVRFLARGWLSQIDRETAAITDWHLE